MTVIPFGEFYVISERKIIKQNRSSTFCLQLTHLSTNTIIILIDNCLLLKLIWLSFSDDDDEDQSEHSSPNVSNSMINPGLMNRTSPQSAMPSGSPSAVLPGLSQGQSAIDRLNQATMDGLNQSETPRSQANSQTAATPESADSPSPYPSAATVQSTIEKATSFISTSIPPGIIPGYPSVEFSHSPVGLTPSALWPTGWPQQAYYKQ